MVAVICAWCRRTRVGTDWRPETPDPELGEVSHGMCPSCHRDMERTLHRGRTVAETVAVCVADDEAQLADMRLVGPPDEAALPGRVAREIQRRVGVAAWLEVRDVAEGCYRAVLARRLSSW